MVRNKIKEYREAKHMSQGALALKCGLGQSTVSEIEAGKHEPTIGVALLLARALGVAVGAIFELKE